jgi:hypothetical protein
LRTQPEATSQTLEEPKKKSFLPCNKKNFKIEVEAYRPQNFKCFFQIFNCQKRKKRIWRISKRQKKKQRIMESRDIERARERVEEKRGQWSE